VTAAQEAAFLGATGHPPAGFGNIVSSILVVLLFIWAAWLVAQVMGSRLQGRARDIDLLSVALRASALIWIALYIVQ